MAVLHGPPLGQINTGEPASHWMPEDWHIGSIVKGKTGDIGGGNGEEVNVLLSEGGQPMVDTDISIVRARRAKLCLKKKNQVRSSALRMHMNSCHRGCCTLLYFGMPEAKLSCSPVPASKTYEKSSRSFWEVFPYEREGNEKQFLLAGYIVV
ncbi:hypothetical protein AAY473_013717 [Plecturocebus cupreus]